MLKALKKSFVGKFCKILMFDFKNLKSNFKTCIAALFRFSNAIIYLQTPLHGNVGDLAIAEATLQWLHNNISNVKVYEFVYGEPTLLHKIILGLAIRKKDLIVLHGGGNLGTWYPAEEKYREFIIEKYPKNNIVVFPQSVFFDKSDEQKNRKIGEVYSKHKNLLVCVRDKISLEIAKEYLNCNLILVPDIVLSYKTNNVNKNTSSNKVLLCLRNDREKKITNDVKNIVSQYVEKNLGMTVEEHDTHIGHHVTLKTRKDTVEDMLRQYADARLVITDRFHGGIFAYITGTPCVVLEPRDHKVRGGFEWLKVAGNITMPTTQEEMLADIVKLNNCITLNNLYEKEFIELKNYILMHI